MKRMILFLIGLGFPLFASADSGPAWRQSKEPEKPKAEAEKKPAPSNNGLVPSAAQEPLPAPMPVPTVPKKLPDLAPPKTEPLPTVSDEDPEVEKQRLRQQMLDLIKKLSEKRPDIPPPPKAKDPKDPGVTPKPKIEIPTTGSTPDQIRLAQNLYRINDTAGAYQIFSKLDPSIMSRDDRPFVQYMTACCLRKLGKLQDAAKLYREVSDAKEDEFLAECSIWQVEQIRTLQELEAQLAQLRSRLKTK
jgi:hypothetical protein